MQMQSMAKISVVVTNYNKSKYIKDTLISIINNVFQNFEIIIVDDCSIDNSITIINDFIKENPCININLIENTKNMGAGWSRRIGIEHAQGEWISLIDADDWIDPDYFKTLLKYQEKNSADIVLSRFIYEESNASRKDSFHYSKEIILQDKYIMINNITLLGLDCLSPALIKATLFKKIGGYCPARFVEDTPTFLAMFPFINSLHIVPYFGYHYRQISESLMHNHNDNEYLIAKMYNCIDAIEFVKSVDIELGNYVQLQITQLFKQKSHFLQNVSSSSYSQNNIETIKQYYQLDF